VLKPVNEFQHASEADGAGIAYVVNRWLQIKRKWAEMREADQFPDVPWDDIDAIFKARLDKQTYDIHWIADASGPIQRARIRNCRPASLRASKSICGNI
jgi:hypothetical protein